ncbi:MAG: TrkH family potassium uptake protein, partial [Acidimicrobiales bacterium]|nr:TrkH family potassium uptake protein [Acidimicrobiales bacterium]
AGLGVLPVAIAGAELVPHSPLEASRRLVRGLWSGTRRIFGLYLLLSSSLMIGFLLAGLSVFDAVSYAMSVSSTGGFANHADSIGHFDDQAVTTVATVGMFAAGGNLAVVWWAFRGAYVSVWKSTELRLYVCLSFIGFVIVWASSGDLGVIESAFAVASVVSTTGLRSANWAGTNDLVVTILIVGAGIGAMSASVGSGFRMARVARIAIELRRSLRRLLYPHRVEVIRMDGVAIDEESLERTITFLWMHTLALGATALFLNATNYDLLGTLTMAIGLMSNVGLVVDGSELSNVVDLSDMSRAVAAFFMVLGRLSIYPVLLTIGGIGRWFRRARPARLVEGPK